MISQESLRNFAIVNSLTVTVGTAFYFLAEPYPWALLFLMLVKNYLTVAGINPGGPLQLEWLPFVKSTCIDTLSYSIVRYSNVYPTQDITKELIWFIPSSFVFELIFDFFYYWMHRAFHTNRFLYKNVHAVHHEDQITTVYTTFHHSFPDLLLTNTVPLLLTSICFPVPAYTFALIFCYKNIAEVAGHSGVNKKTPSFVQCIWLPKALGIELYTRNHCLHHEMPQVNFSKRFSIWDKIFGTFDSRMPKQMSKVEAHAETLRNN